MKLPCGTGRPVRGEFVLIAERVQSEHDRLLIERQLAEQDLERRRALSRAQDDAGTQLLAVVRHAVVGLVLRPGLFRWQQVAEPHVVGVPIHDQHLDRGVQQQALEEHAEAVRLARFAQEGVAVEPLAARRGSTSPVPTDAAHVSSPVAPPIGST